MPRLEIVAEGHSNTISFRGSLMTIGRQDDNDVVLADTKASRKHCRIEYVEGIYRLKDLDSHNGTWLGHERVQERNLSFGQAIRIGSTYIRLVPDPKDLNENAMIPSLEALVANSPEADALELLAGGKQVIQAPSAQPRRVKDRPKGSPFTVVLGQRSTLQNLPTSAPEVGLHNARREPIVLEMEEDPQVREAMHWLRELIYSSLNADASAIHIEPQSRAYLLRFRIDGVLHTVGEVPIRDARCVVEAIRRLCELDPRPEKVAESGCFVVETAGEHFTEYRSHFVSTGLGQRAVLARLDPVKTSVPIESLGLDLDSVATITRQVERQKGLMLFTGPSASGKTTTGYCIANAVDPASRSVAIIEETREYPLPAAIRLTADGLGGKRLGELIREAIQQDSDAMLIGTLTDRECATVALEAAINGRLVLATMDAPGIEAAIIRLLGWGVEPYLIANGIGIMTSQRLIRVLCPDCRRPYEPDAALLQKRGMADRAHGAFYEAVGCPKCLKTGYCGQIGVFELMQSGNELRDNIISRPSVADLRNSIAANTIQTLTDSAIKKVIEGVTTIAEIDRVLQIA